MNKASCPRPLESIKDVKKEMQSEAVGHEPRVAHENGMQ
jgi:hypothetical protein